MHATVTYSSSHKLPVTEHIANCMTKCRNAIRHCLVRLLQLCLICTRTLRVCRIYRGGGGFLDSQKRHFRIHLSSGVPSALNYILALRNVHWQLNTDVSEQRVIPIFKGQAVKQSRPLLREKVAVDGNHFLFQTAADTNINWLSPKDINSQTLSSRT